MTSHKDSRYVSGVSEPSPPSWSMAVDGSLSSARCNASLDDLQRQIDEVEQQIKSKDCLVRYG